MWLRFLAGAVAAIAMQMAAVLPDVAPVGAAVAPVTAQIPAVLPDVAPFLPRRRCIPCAKILPAFALVLPDIAPVAACVTAVLAQVAPVATHLMTISGGVAGLLSGRDGGEGRRPRRATRGGGAGFSKPVLQKV